MKRLVLPLATVTMIFIVTDVSAEPGRKGARGASAARGPGAQAGGVNPAQMAQRLVQMGDKTGDGSLNPQELAAALTAMRQMRADAAKGPGARGGRDGAGAARGDKGPPAGDNPQRAAGRRGPAGAAGGIDPEQVAKRMCDNNDTNGDGALNPQELAAAFAAMRAKRGRGGPAGAGGPRAAGGQRPRRPQ